MLTQNTKKTKPKDAAPRRRGRGAGKQVEKVKVEEKTFQAQYKKKVAKEKFEHAKAVDELIMGQGVINDIPISCSVDVDAFTAIYIGIVSMALTQEFEDSYGAYTAGFNDLISLINGGPGTVSTRLAYLNDILGGITPKILPFRLKGKIGYAFNNNNLQLAGPSFPIRGKLIYFFNKGSTISGGWTIQEPPSVYSEADLMKLYNDMNTLLTANVEHLQVSRNVTLSKKYTLDASMYARSSPYEGAGYSPISGWFNSVEAEIPFRSSFLATLLPFSTSEERSSRKLKDSAGDSALAFALGLHPDWSVDKYNGPVPIVLMPLDIDEFIFTITQYVVLAIQARRQLPLTSDSDLLACAQQWPFTYMDWSLMWRQQIVTMFSRSQAETQTLIYGSGNNRWESLKVGSNCCGLVGATKATIPQILNVNLACLREVIDQYTTARLNKSRNVVRYIPVWGAYLQRDPDFNIDVTELGETIPDYLLFSPIDPVYPDFWDGTYNNAPADLNRSGRLANVLDFWNTIVIPAIEQVSAPTEPMGGRHMGSPFIKLARYCSYFDGDFDLSNTPEWKVKKLPKKHVVSRSIVNDKRLSEKKQEKMIKRFFAPSGYSLFTTATEAYTAVNTITDTHKEWLPQMIIPVFDVSDSANRGLITRVMVQNQHTNIYKTTSYGAGSLNDVSSTRGTELLTLATFCIKGTAGETSTLAKYYAALANEDKGGFFGDLLAAVAPIVSALGF